MESVEALNSLTMTTPQALFPNRKLGDLTVGGEATFVMLGQNPLVDFGAIRDVKRVVKRGETLRDNTDK
jgi:imidazolonepropionase-like amidohydrolase